MCWILENSVGFFETSKKKKTQWTGQKKLFDLRAIRSGWGRTLSGVADELDAEELLCDVFSDEATINSLEINTTYTFHNKMSLKIILLEFFYSMFSFNPFVINNQAIGDR